MSVSTRTPSLEDFVDEAQAFLDSTADRRTADASGRPDGPDVVPVFAHDTGKDAEREIAGARRWASQRFAAGFGWVDGPGAYGGRGLPASYADSFRRLEARYDTPSLSSLMVGLKIAVPTLLAHAGPDLRDRFIPAILAGDVVVCQLFSEPEAGSDLASLRTRAVVEQGIWSVTGQKVWTSEAQHADVGLLLARTSTVEPRHRGITMFLADMTDPAVAIRPLRQMTGDYHFNEVFIDGLRIDDGLRIGDVDDGWSAARTVLGSERQAVAARDDSPESALFERLVALARQVASGRLSDDPLLRDAVVRAFVAVRVLEATNRMHSAGGDHLPGSAASVSKLLKNRALGAIMAATECALGPALVADTGEWGTYSWSRALLAVPGQRIAGGTDEIQRNILGERELGLPRQPS